MQTNAGRTISILRNSYLVIVALSRKNYFETDACISFPKSHISLIEITETPNETKWNERRRKENGNCMRVCVYMVRSVKLKISTRIKLIVVYFFIPVFYIFPYEKHSFDMSFYAFNHRGLNKFDFFDLKISQFETQTIKPTISFLVLLTCY